MRIIGGIAIGLVLVACAPGPDPLRGVALLHAREGDGDLYVDARRIGPAHAETAVPLSRGTHVAELRRGRTVIVATTFEIRTAASIDVTLEPPIAQIADAAVGGRLDIRSEPEGATVFVDGIRAGLSPLVIDLPAGPHRVELASPGMRAHDEEIVIGVGAATEIEIALSEME